MIQSNKLVLTLLCCGLLTACAPKPRNDLTTLEGLSNLSSSHSEVKRNAASQIRVQALKEGALSVGAQAGLAKRAEEINAMLNKNARQLDSVFEFNQLMLDHNVVPPVLVEAHRTLNVDGDNSLRIADRTYQIEKQAHLSSTPPHWREYLWLHFPKPEKPHDTLLPHNAAEKRIWANFIQEGWDYGSEQADMIYNDGLALIKRDYNGMVLYRKLLLQKMISPPYVARSELGITGGGQDMRINDQVLRITTLPQLIASSKNWNPVLSNRTLKYLEPVHIPADLEEKLPKIKGKVSGAEQVR